MGRVRCHVRAAVEATTFPQAPVKPMDSRHWTRDSAKVNSSSWKFRKYPGAGWGGVGQAIAF
eukprot:763935-Hanusia_phi.AAC.4